MLAHLFVQCPQLVRQFLDVIRYGLADLIEMRVWYWATDLKTGVDEEEFDLLYAMTVWILSI